MADCGTSLFCLLTGMLLTYCLYDLDLLLWGIFGWHQALCDEGGGLNRGQGKQRAYISC